MIKSKSTIASTASRVPRSFSVEATTLLLTYKGVGHSKAVIQRNARMLALSKSSIIGICVSKERYLNGDPHYHVYLEVKDKSKWDIKELDLIGGIHGHYKAIRQTPDRALAYVVKDRNFYFYPKEFKATIDSAVMKHCLMKTPSSDPSAPVTPQLATPQPVNFKTKPSSGPPNKKSS